MLPARRLEELAAHVEGEVLGDPSLVITGVNGLLEASGSEVSFYGNPKYRRQLATTKAGAVLINGQTPERTDLTFVRVANPQLAFARLSALFHPPPVFAPGNHRAAHVDPASEVHPTATVMAGAVVEAGARVGARTVLFPNAYVGEQASIGDDCVLYPGAVVRERCVVGHRVILHANSVVGADGFGFTLDAEKLQHCKIPQAGIARIEDDVELGACSCVDRATLGETVIGRGTKIDNLVQIAHNVKVGAMSILCAQVGVAGSSELGQGVVLAGQAGIADHVRIGNLARVGAQGGVSQEVEDGQTVSGHPAMDHVGWLRSSVAFKELPDVVRELRALRRKVEALEREKGGNR